MQMLLVEGAGVQSFLLCAERAFKTPSLSCFKFCLQDLFAPDVIVMLQPMPALVEMLDFMLVRNPVLRPSAAEVAGRYNCFHASILNVKPFRCMLSCAVGSLCDPCTYHVSKHKHIHHSSLTL